MTTAASHLDNRPWRWVPSLYFAEGLPYVIVTGVSVILFKRLGLSNTDVALFTSWLYLPWVVKPIWSPLVDLLRTKRFWIIVMQLCVGAALGGVALAIPTDTPIRLCMLFLWLIAFSSATHDIAADGFYMHGLTQHQQVFFVGIRNTFYRIAMISAQGLLVMLAGILETSALVRQQVPLAWAVTFGVAGVVVFALALYHYLVLPRPASDAAHQHVASSLLSGFGRTFRSFFEKAYIGRILAFLLLYRFAEAQLVKLAAPFLLDNARAGGLGLATTDVGFIYGVVGVATLVLGGLVGAAVAAKHGLKRWLIWMVAAINLPNAVYLGLTLVPDVTLPVVGAAVALEQFGYGFGFTGYTLYMLYVSDGEHRTSHFAICTGFMAIGMMVPGLVSGAIQEWMGYQGFFAWVLLATIPSFIVALSVPITDEFGRDVEGA